MSKQDDAKLAQGYSTTPANCGNCEHFNSEFKPPKWMVEQNDRRATNPAYFVEGSMRCGIGGFAVKKTASCGRHQMRGA